MMVEAVVGFMYQRIMMVEAIFLFVYQRIIMVEAEVVYDVSLTLACSVLFPVSASFTDCLDHNSILTHSYRLVSSTELLIMNQFYIGVLCSFGV